MKIRSLIAATAGVSLLTLAIAIPVSAGGPATFKVAQRGVEYAVTATATNCPDGMPKHPGMDATRAAAPVRADVAAALKLKTGRTTKAETNGRDYPCSGSPNEKFEEAQDYFAIWTTTTLYDFRQAGSGYEFTGLGFDVPVTGVHGMYWQWHESAGAVPAGWTAIPIGNPILWLDADEFAGDWSDLAWGGAATYIPVLDAELVVGPCGSLGPWVRKSMVDTGGIDPGDGWTVNVSTRYRQCYMDLGQDYWPPVGGGVAFVTYNGPHLPPTFVDATLVDAQLSRSVVTAVDVYYPW